MFGTKGKMKEEDCIENASSMLFGGGGGGDGHYCPSPPAAAAAAASSDLPTAAKQAIASQTALAGRIWPLLSQLGEALNPTEVHRLGHRFYKVFHYQDLLTILILGWGTIPLVKSLYRLLYSRQTSQTTTIITPFYHTRLYVAIYYFCQAIQLSLLVYIFDLLLVVCWWEDILDTQQQTQPPKDNGSDTNVSTTSPLDYSWLFGKILYTLWGAHVGAKFKHYLLITYLGVRKNKDGLALLIDHILNAMIGGVAAMIIIDILELSGLGIRSAFALGSAGTLAITLGTQTLVTHIVSGFTMTTSNRFYVGDLVKFGSAVGGNAFMGTIVSMGWLETTIRGADELIHTVPNAKLEGIAVSNLSRHERCQVKQTLRFHYEDVHKLPELMIDMRNEIIAATSEFIVTDGSRPCRVCWTGYTQRFLEVLVDVHFEGIKPVGDKYCANREKVLMAIQKAVDKHGMKFAVLKCCCSTGGKDGK